MSTHFSFVGLGIASALLIAVSLGCGGEPQSEAPPAADNTSVNEEESEVNEAFAELSPADRKLAAEQKVCPVSDEPLGSMGTPIKVTVEGRDIFVCCEGCVEELKSNFDMYAAKLDKK